MKKKYWYKLEFVIDSNLDELIIWKLNDINIFTYSFEYLSKAENKQKVNIWLPVSYWNAKLRNNLEHIIFNLLNISSSNKNFLDWSVVEEEDWLSSWKKYWTPNLVGEHLLILPCWFNLDEKYKDKNVIKIDPGAAFGTGSHPSTYLCLEKMENIIFTGKKVLDIGSGSGILSITARSLGAKEIYAIDNDYLAVNSTKSNYRLNFGNLDNLKTYEGTFNEIVNKYTLKNFNVIFCNILAEVIKEIIPNIKNCLRKNGKVILSGILNTQKDEILKILNLNHLKLIDISFRKDWVCITAKKSS